MKVFTFFKILNKKIEQYNKAAANPFERQQPIVLIWVEDSAFKENTESIKE